MKNRKLGASCNAWRGKCRGKMVVAFRVWTDEGPCFFHFCRGHLWLAAKVLLNLAGKRRLPMSPKK
jgi:hypothetical protein